MSDDPLQQTIQIYDILFDHIHGALAKIPDSKTARQAIFASLIHMAIRFGWDHLNLRHFDLIELAVASSRTVAEENESILKAPLPTPYATEKPTP